MLKRVYVDNFRCLQNFEFRPGLLSVVVGPNGGGKSTVFDVLKGVQMFLGLAGMPVRQVFGPGTLTRWDSRPVQKIEIEVELPNGLVYLYRLEIKHSDDRRDASVDERLSLGGEDLYRLTNGEVQLFGDPPAKTPRIHFPVDPRRSFLPILEPRPDNQRIMEFKHWVRGMLLFKLRPDQIDPNTKGETDAITHDGGNFVSWYRTLQQESPTIPESLRQDMQSIIPGLSSIRLQKVGADEKVLAFDCDIGGKTATLFLDELSDGQRVLLVLYTVMHAFASRATLLVFDEPDNFVASSEIQPWLAGMRDRMVAVRCGTLLVISHHPEVIDYLAPDQVLQIWREDGPSRVREVEFDLDKAIPASTQLLLGVPGG